MTEADRIRAERLREAFSEFSSGAGNDGEFLFAFRAGDADLLVEALDDWLRSQHDDEAR